MNRWQTWLLVFLVFRSNLLAQTVPRISLAEVSTHDGAIWVRCTIEDPSGIVRRLQIYDTHDRPLYWPVPAGENTPDPTLLKWTGADSGRHLLRVLALGDGEAQLAWSSQADLFVLPSGEALVILEQPQSQLVVQGTSATVQVRVLSDLRIRYQWLHDGTSLPGETNATLVLTNISPRQSGYYSARLDTPLAVFPSADASLAVTVTTPGSVLFQNRVEQDGVVVLDRPLFPSIADTHQGSLNTNQLVLRYTVQLQAGLVPEHLFPIGNRTFIRKWTTSLGSGHAGYFEGGTLSVPFAEPGDTVYVQVFVRLREYDPWIWISWEPFQVSSCFAIRLGDAMSPTLLEKLVFPAYAEWPQPRPVVWDSAFLVEPGGAFTLEAGGFSYSEVDQEWRRWGRSIPESRGKNLPWEGPGHSVPIQGLYAVDSIRLTDVANYTFWLSSAYHQEASTPVSVVMLKPAAGKFISAPQRSGKSVRLFFQGQGNVRYTLQVSQDLVAWTDVCEMETEDGSAFPEVEVQDTSRNQFFRALRP